MAVVKYIVEIDKNDNGFWDGKITDASGNQVPSHEIYDLQHKLAFMASTAAGIEASAHVKPDCLYWCRGKRGVGYVMVTSVDQGKVFVRDSDKNGVVDHTATPHEFYEPQRLILAKNQPQAS